MHTAVSTALPPSAKGIWQLLSTFDFRLIDELCYLSRRTAERSTRNAHYCTPGRAYLARKLGVTVGTISRHTSRLKRLGVLDKIQRRPVHGTWQTCLYAVIAPAAWSVARVRQVILRVSHRVRLRAHKASPERTETPQTVGIAEHRARIARLMRIGHPENP